MSVRWFSPVEMARRLGISAKTLRVYEAVGLVTPARTQKGWRVYGPSEQARLHQILALKRLGLSLARIGALLTGRLADLDAVLDVQEAVLRARKRDAEHALKILAAARLKLARDGALSADDLLQLTRETTMTRELKSDEDWREAFQPIIENQYSPEELDRLGRRKMDALTRLGHDAESFTRSWEALIEELRALRAADDLVSPRACEFVRRWNAMTTAFTGGDPDITRKTRAIWEQAASDPQIAPRLPIKPEDFVFVQRIANGMRERGELLSS